MTPPAAEGYFSRATLTDLLCEKFTACRVKSSLHLDSDARRGTTRDVELEPFEMAVHPLHDRSTGRPLTPLTWFETINLCNELSNAEELQPAYTHAGDGRSVTWNTSADGYRLPTEAEWEYACRAGTTSPTYGPLEDIAWTGLDHLEGPQPVVRSENP